MGAKGYRVRSMEELEPTLKEAMELHAPVVIECIVDHDDKVFPMVAPGASIDDVFSAEDM